MKTVLLLQIVLVTTQNASAYIDPNATSLIARFLAGFFAFILFFGKDLLAIISGRSEKEKISLFINYDLIIFSETRSYHFLFSGDISEQIAKSGRVLYLTSDPEELLLLDRFSKESVHRFHLKSYGLRWFVLRFVSGKVFLTSNVYLGTPQFPKSLCVKKYCYRFHTLMSPLSIYRSDAFNFFNEIEYPTSRHAEALRELKKSQTKLVAKLLPRKYDLFTYLSDQPTSIKEGLIYLCPTRDSQFYEAIPKSIFTHENVNIVLRPHPLERSQYRELKKTYPNIEIETCDLKESRFLQAQMMITDWSGIAFEYTYLTKRKFYFLPLPQKIEGELATQVFENEFWNHFGISFKGIGLDSSIKLKPEEVKILNRFLLERQS